MITHRAGEVMAEALRDLSPPVFRTPLVGDFSRQAQCAHPKTWRAEIRESGLRRNSRCAASNPRRMERPDGLNHALFIFIALARAVSPRPAYRRAMSLSFIAFLAFVALAKEAATKG